MEMVDDDFLTSLEVGCFVALHFSNYEKEPVIGKGASDRKFPLRITILKCTIGKGHI